MNTTKQHITLICALALLACCILTGTTSAGRQESFIYSFQPSFPFNMGQGRILALRPAIPVVIQQPVFDADKGKFEDESGLGDISLDFIYGQTRPSGWTIPLGAGLAKTLIVGKTPLKLTANVFYNVEEPDAFAQDWGFKISISPVVPNPFAG